MSRAGTADIIPAESEGNMQYKSFRMDGKYEDLTKEQARYILEGCYKKAFVKDIIDNGKEFRLHTPMRDIWTEKDGLVPVAGFYGVCE